MKVELDVTCLKKKEVATSHMTNHQAGTAKRVWFGIYLGDTCLQATAGLFIRN